MRGDRSSSGAVSNTEEGIRLLLPIWDRKVIHNNKGTRSSGVIRNNKVSAIRSNSADTMVAIRLRRLRVVVCSAAATVSSRDYFSKG